MFKTLPKYPLTTIFKLNPDFKTRLHSSRMHTACLLTVSSSMHCAGWISLAGEGSALPGGCLPSQGVSTLQGGRSALPEGVVVSQHALRQIPLCGQNSWHTLLKILPCPQTLFVGSNKWSSRKDEIRHLKPILNVYADWQCGRKSLSSRHHYSFSSWNMNSQKLYKIQPKFT